MPSGIISDASVGFGGTLVLMGPDHPVTGGYLQPATVISTDRWKLAQLAPGDRIRLVAV